MFRQNFKAILNLRLFSKSFLLLLLLLLLVLLLLCDVTTCDDETELNIVDGGFCRKTDESSESRKTRKSFGEFFPPKIGSIEKRMLCMELFLLELLFFQRRLPYFYSNICVPLHNNILLILKK